MAKKIGDIIHYYDEGYKALGENGVGPYPAMITKVHTDEVVDLQVFPIDKFGIEPMKNVEAAKRAGERKNWWVVPS